MTWIFRMYLFWINTNTISFLVLTLEVPKKSLKIYENMFSFWKKKENIKGFCVVVLWAKVVLKMLFRCNNKKKKECDMNTRKHMILFNKEGYFDRESLMAL